MIEGDALSDARSRLKSDGDRDIFDRALAAAQGEDPFIRAMLECGLSMAGLEPADLAYQQHLYPFDTVEQARAMALSQSGCGLTTEEIWREGAVADSRLKMAYATRVKLGGTSYAVACEKSIALSCDAWTNLVKCETSIPRAAVLTADAWIIGCKGCPGEWARLTGTYEHEFSCLLVEDDGVTVHSIDGGQPGIALRTRKLVWAEAHHELWLASLDATIGPDGRPSKGRRAQGFTRVRDLPRY